MPSRAWLAARWTPAFAGVTEGSCGRRRLTGALSRPRQGDDEAGAGDVAVVAGAVGGDDLAAVRLDDLLGDAEPEAGVGAELLAGGPLAVEAVEDRRDLVRRDAGALVRDDGADGLALAPHL